MNNFRRVGVISGIIFGLVMFALDILLFDSQNWFFAIFLGLITGLLSGLCLWFIAYLLFRTINISWACHTITALLLTMTGVLLGLGLFFIMDRIPRSHWIQVAPPPPERANHFLDQSNFNFFGGTIYIMSENGNIFSYKFSSESPPYWIKESSLPGEPEVSYEDCPPGRKLTYIPPILLFKKIADSAQIDLCGPDYEIQVNLIILDDGSVWFWQKYDSVYMFVFILPLWLIIGFIAGFTSYRTLIRQSKMTIQNEGNP